MSQPSRAAGPGEGSADPNALPALRHDGLRRRLFLPQLERLLGDPADLPLDDSSDSVRVRLEEAIAALERRCAELVEATRRSAGAYRFACLLGSAFGALAVTASLAFASRPQLRSLLLALGLAELAPIAILLRLQRRAIADAGALARLAGRYRPRLESCRRLEELRELAGTIHAELAQLWIPPGDTGGGDGEGRPAAGAGGAAPPRPT
jgi:hypothetical protein